MNGIGTCVPGPAAAEATRRAGPCEGPAGWTGQALKIRPPERLLSDRRVPTAGKGRWLDIDFPLTVGSLPRWIRLGQQKA